MPTLATCSREKQAPRTKSPAESRADRRYGLT
jgi:hypothetical protein